MAAAMKQLFQRSRSQDVNSRRQIVPITSRDSTVSPVDNIPPLPLQQWKESIKASYTGPNSGLTSLDLHNEEFPSPSSPLSPSTAIPGVQDWKTFTEHAYGISLSLYEEDKTRGCVVGEPNADVFAVLERDNNTILAVADGASWGKKPRLAARCAVHTAIGHLVRNTDRFNLRPHSRTLATIFMEALNYAHQCILDNHATLTTLSIAVICELKTQRRLSPTPPLPSYALFTASVGDSPIYIYSPRMQTVAEATESCHPKDGIRTANFSGGALGPAIGSLPDMENLSLDYRPVQKDDIVFVTSDGVSDNFYPQTIRPGLISRDDPLVASAPDLSSFILIHGGGVSSKEVPPISSHSPTPLIKKCCQNIVEMESVLRRHEAILSSRMTAQTVAAALINYIVELTEEKRRFYTKCKEEGVMIKMKCREDPEFARMVNRLPGKLDHATVVAYSVGNGEKR